ncbi:MAG: M20/M25/M40 family metallo-hydrolase [Planctomycetes bacterium]|nr:M20/M25/M40 family metallo-hydrolase [Planctomycetota bacterium]MCC7170241.1 M20/M25/M40 family metallo-hydrolase [Planctomycetota bacterium]
MRRIAVSCSTWFVLVATTPLDVRAQESTPELSAALKTINGKDVQATIDFLTSRECAGRDTAQAGLDRAIGLVTERFERLGLESVSDSGNAFLAPWSVPVVDAAACSLELAGEGQAPSVWAVREDFVPAKGCPDGSVEGDLLFAGFSVSERKYHWDDFAKVDAKKRIVVALLGEPGDGKNKKFFEGSELTASASVLEKAKAAAEAGAVGLILCPSSAEESTLWLGSQVPVVSQSGRGGGGAPLPIPTVVVSLSVAESLLGEPADAVRERVVARGRTASEPLRTGRAKLAVAMEARQAPVANVLGRYRGRDPDLAGDIIVIGAHIDHIGVDDRGRICHGADDNAGGVAAVLEIAEAFATAKPATKRSIVFMAFTGEEKGLLGSKAYCKDPLIPIARTYAMINLDIIARGRKNAIEATLPPGKSAIDRLLPAASRLSGANLKIGDGGHEYFQRSDQYSFHEVGIPTVFFNEGATNEDYHQPSDTADKVLEDKVAAVAKVSCTLAFLLANTDIKGGLK